MVLSFRWTNNDDFGTDVNREISFSFLRDDLVDTQLVPEVGDIIMLNEDYYEVDAVKENEYFFGKDNNYNYGRSNKFGTSITITCTTHLTRAERVNLSPENIVPYYASVVTQERDDLYSEDSTRITL